MVTITENTGAVSGSWVYATISGTVQEVVDAIKTKKANRGMFVLGLTHDGTNLIALVEYLKQ